MTQVPKKLVQYTKDKNYGDEKADIRDLEGVLREKKDQYSDFDTSDDESLYLMQQAEFFCADDVSARITRTEKELSEDSPGKAYAEEYEEEETVEETQEVAEEQAEETAEPEETVEAESAPVTDSEHVEKILNTGSFDPVIPKTAPAELKFGKNN